MKEIRKLFLPFLLIIFLGGVLSVSIKGIVGNPTEKTLDLKTWTDDGPFELSPDRGRFALAYSIAENHSFHFSIPVARFAVPDLGYKDGNYVSLFPPFLSFIILPGYLIGKFFGITQVTSFATVAFFALLNVLLIRLIAHKLGAPLIASTIAGVIFLFATPAFSYATSLYQHHVSTFLMLFSLYILLMWDNFWSLALIWFLFATSIPLDNPNGIFMLPIALFALGRIILIKKERLKMVVKVKVLRFITFFTILIPLLFFLWINYRSYGNPLQVAGTVGSVYEVGPDGKPAVPKEYQKKAIDTILNPNKQEKSAASFFRTRNLLNGFYLHFVSPDRGILYYTPVIFLSVFGVFALFQRNKNYTALLLSIIGANVLLYSLWGDPWGGWAFGSRYLIPSYALFCIFLSFALAKYKNHKVFMGFFILFMIYSTLVNTVGAITSNRNPPQVEVLALEKLTGRVEKYTYERDIDLLKTNFSKSFVWQTVAKPHVSAILYYFLLCAIINSVLIVLTIVLMAQRRSYDNV